MELALGSNSILQKRFLIKLTVFFPLAGLMENDTQMFNGLELKSFAKTYLH